MFIHRHYEYLKLLAPDGGDGGGAAGDGNGGDGGQKAPESFDDFLANPDFQAEFDRRVQKALNTQKTKIEAGIQQKIDDAVSEAKKLQRMNAEQKAAYEREQTEQKLAEREASITRRELAATAKETLAEKGLPTSLSDILDYTDAEKCKASIESVAKAFKEAVDQAVESRLKGGDPLRKAPEKQKDDTEYSVEDIQKMMKGW